MENEPGLGRSVRAYGRYFHLGPQFVITIGVLALGGNWIDGRLDTQPWFLIVGFALGFGAAFYNLYQEVYGEKKGR